MCIIAAKPAGTKMPDYRYIDNMFINNSDGAGLMYAINGKVHIEKGFMSRLAFLDKLDDLDEKYGLNKLPLVMHFRITTHGGTKPENCHPFPVTDSIGMMKKLKSTVTLGVAHNGIINVTPRSKEISDTMEYIAGQLAPLRRAVPYFYKSKDLMEMVYNAITSKMVIMDADGEMYFLGDFWEEEGVKYSNTSYRYGKQWRNFPYSLNEHWGSFEYEETVMWLDETKGEYVLDPENEMLQGDFAIDKMGNVYYYDQDIGLLISCGDMTAHTSEGTLLRYDEESDMISSELVEIEYE